MMFKIGEFSQITVAAMRQLVPTVAVSVAGEVYDELAGRSTGEHRIRHLANASKFACTVHSGQIWDIVQVIMALMMWIKTNGYEMAGGIHEIHLSGKETSKTDFDNIVFEFQIPVQPFRT